MRCLDEATASALAGEATIPISGAWACCFLVTACTAVLEYERAVEWCDRIAEFADRYGSRYMLAFCRAEYGAVHPWRGQWREAEEMLEASVEDFARSRPARVAGPLVGLAELRRRQGRAEEAALLLDRAGPSASAQLRQAPAERKLDRAPALELLVRARVARGELEEAREPLDSLREIETVVRTEPLRASIELAEGLIEAASGNHERARTLFEDAVDRFERCGAAFEASQARIELATSFAALGRTDVANKRRRRPSIACSGWAPRRRPSVRADCSKSRSAATPTARGCRGSRGGSARCWPACEGAHQPSDRRAAGGLRAHSPSPRHQHPAKA